MGCCISKKDRSSKGSAPPALGSEKRRDIVKEENNREPPPAPQEEETVKEVLSETPKPPLVVIPTGGKGIEKELPKPSAPAIPAEEKKLDRRSSLLSSNDETSEMSEICSLSESISTTITEKKEENGFEEVEMRPNDYRSPSKFQRKRALSGDYTGRRGRGGKSPARISEPSPARKTPGREGQTVARSRISNKRDPGEDSGRRSRSPAVRRDSKGAATPRNELTRSASARKTVRLPRLVAEELAKDTNPQLERARQREAPADESLENPLVSLECFIFL
ncbi:pre-mRNA-splicing factor cwc22-like [Aristolochia californica]|uniref:pre-mRNA-splicing factor cwc22-like n=1 Tax=Aristolochia californica TaxID=171875 RepID=UPI0035DA051A